MMRRFRLSNTPKLVALSFLCSALIKMVRSVASLKLSRMLSAKVSSILSGPSVDVTEAVVKGVIRICRNKTDLVHITCQYEPLKIRGA